MRGNQTGLFELVKRGLRGESGHTAIIESLASKDLIVELSDVFVDLVNTVNFIKRNALNTRLFSSLCQDFGSEHSSLIGHSEV